MKVLTSLQVMSSIQAQSNHLSWLCKDRNYGTWKARE